MFQHTFLILTLVSLLVVGQCGRYHAPISSKVDFPYRRVPTIRELIEDAGFQYDRYNAITEDGHILALHRISPPTGHDLGGVPVLLINGFSFQSDGWLLLGNASLPFILARLGYDVWLGDVRGSARSAGHVSYTFEDVRANNYTFHELGIYDLPAFIDFIIEKTGKEKVLYVGISLSAGMLVIMNSEKPEYNEKVLGAALIAPAGHLQRYEDTDFIYRANIFTTLHIVNGAIRTGNWIYPNPKDMELAKKMLTLCYLPLVNIFCTLHLVQTIGTSSNIDPMIMFYQLAAGITSVNMYVAKHLHQVILLGRFCKFDYGFDKNLEIYGQEYPPTYEFNKTMVPVFIIHGGKDRQVWSEAAQRTGKQLGNLKKRKLIPNFNHAEFIMSKKAPEVVYEDVVDFFDKLSENSTDTAAR